MVVGFYFLTLLLWCLYFIPRRPSASLLRAGHLPQSLCWVARGGCSFFIHCFHFQGWDKERKVPLFFSPQVRRHLLWSHQKSCLAVGILSLLLLAFLFFSGLEGILAKCFGALQSCCPCPWLVVLSALFLGTVFLGPSLSLCLGLLFCHATNQPLVLISRVDSDHLGVSGFAFAFLLFVLLPVSTKRL